MHLPPEVWGPIFWCCFHLVSLGYPDNPTFAEKRSAKEFFNSMIFLLPCPSCREHFKEILQGSPVEPWLDNRRSLTEWVWSLHNQVNTRLKKPTLSQPEFYSRYSQMASRGLPIPPSAPLMELTDQAEQAAWIRGAASVAGVMALSGVVGGLLWASYSKK